MPKPLPPRVVALQAKVDALIETPLGTTVKQLSATISAIKKVYYAPLGRDRRTRLGTYLDASYTSLTKLTQSTDKKVAAAALRALPPALRPRPTSKPTATSKPKPKSAR